MKKYKDKFLIYYIKKESKILGKSLFKLEIPDEIKREIQKHNSAKTIKRKPNIYNEKEGEIFMSASNIGFGIRTGRLLNRST